MIVGQPQRLILASDERVQPAPERSDQHLLSILRRPSTRVLEHERDAPVVLPAVGRARRRVVARTVVHARDRERRARCGPVLAHDAERVVVADGGRGERADREQRRLLQRAGSEECSVLAHAHRLQISLQSTVSGVAWACTKT
jgi:hypothetical protein